MGWPEACTALPAPGSIPLDDPRNDAWRALLPRAAAIIAAANGALLPRVTLGGGSMLAMRYGHRESRDLDFFLPDAQLLGLLAPRLNDRIGGLVEAYEEASNFLRFTFGAQEVDFIVGAPVLPRGPSLHLDMAPGLRVAVEPPGEIVAKKLLYRGASLTHRDVIDLALVWALEPAELADLPPRLGARALSVLEARLEKMGNGFVEAATQRVALRREFLGLARAALDLAQQAVQAMTRALSA